MFDGGGADVAAVAEAVGGGHAVQPVVADAVAAGVEVVVAGAVGTVDLLADAGTLAQGFIQAAALLVAELVGGDDADAVRGVAQVQRQAEAAAVAGGVAVALGVDGDRGQLGGVAVPGGGSGAEDGKGEQLRFHGCS